MCQIRVNGRGQQGAVTTGELLAIADLDHCKGCGMCVAECPSGAMTMEPEEI